MYKNQIKQNKTATHRHAAMLVFNRKEEVVVKSVIVYVYKKTRMYKHLLSISKCRCAVLFALERLFNGAALVLQNSNSNSTSVNGWNERHNKNERDGD